MRNRKLIYVLIPLIIVVLILITGVAFLMLNSSPKKIFEHSINKVFGMLETSEEQHSTMKGTMKFTASVESDNEQMQEINTMLEGTSINLDMQADTANMVINENLSVILNNENLLNAAILLQDQKGYIYLKDFLDKYLEVPQEDMEYSDLTEYYDKIDTIDQNALMEAINEELVSAILTQELIKEDTTLVIDGQETKVTASTLNLQGKSIVKFTNGFLSNLKANQKFQTGLGEFKDDATTLINDILADENSTSEDMQIVFTIYTKGILNKFVGVSGRTIDTYYEESIGIELLKHNDGKCEFVVYNEYEGEREEAFNVTVEDKKESKYKGTTTVTMTVDEERFVVIYNYEKQGNKTAFVASTEIEGVTLSISGNAIEEGENINGNIKISVQEETFGKVNVNCVYDFTYNVQVQKVNIGISVLIDELSEEDQTTLMTNLQNSPIYNITSMLSNEDSLFDAAQDASQQTQNALNQLLPEVTYGGYTVKYTVPDGFDVSEYSSEDFKMYMNQNMNSIDVTINYEAVDTYMENLKNEYIMTSDFYENQNISDTKILNINEKEYKVRTITYNDEYSSYVNLYFAYELDDKYSYIVEVETEGGNISTDTIKNFLDVMILDDDIRNKLE